MKLISEEPVVKKIQYQGKEVYIVDRDFLLDYNLLDSENESLKAEIQQYIKILNAYEMEKKINTDISNMYEKEFARLKKENQQVGGWRLSSIILAGIGTVLLAGTITEMIIILRN